MDSNSNNNSHSFSSSTDIEQMPETPHRGGSYHRRAHSDFSSFRLPNFDDLLLFDPSDLDLSSFPSPSPVPPPRGTTNSNSNSNSAAAAVPMPIDSDDSSASRPRPSSSSGPSAAAAHFRSLSVDSDFFDGLALAGDAGGKEVVGGKRAGGGHHRHSNSMDGSFDSELSLDGLKKSITPDKLAELSLIDPKRAKRILANRQSAARSKERKVRYANELERKVQTLQTEATTLSAQVTLLQRDTTAITAENKELKIRLQSMEQQAQLRDALNEKLKEEVERLKIETSQIPHGSGNPFYRGLPPQYAPPQSALHNQLGGSQSQHQHQHQQLHMLHNQNVNGQPHPSFMDFNQRA
ncbi:putative transcription factor bZIP family [Rosa chinensis]|uniref:Putative transcription factor bZIP family n=1 Tax=Rosa chinensis TaxID=74649 RepID=A0A2P6PS59_ROSCH|nr:transcription factor VIP1 [Rosa chinensis]PRQ24754.1 putative transcription factor bZIP family [Rosa chinensis]